MDSINIIDPSYGNPTDATGSLVSNQIKFKQLSRKNIEAVVAKQLHSMDIVQFNEKKDNIRDEYENTVDEIVTTVQSTPVEEMNQEFKETVKQKSDYARRLEERVQALIAMDADRYVSTLKPIPFGKAKPLKIKPANYRITYENGKKFSTMIEAPKQEEPVDLKQDIVSSNFEPAPVVEEATEIEQVEVPTAEDISAGIDKIMETEVENSTGGFAPETSEMEEVAAIEQPVIEAPIVDEVIVEPELETQNTEEPIPEVEEPVEPVKEENVQPESAAIEIPDKVLTTEEISNEIDRIMNQMESNKDKEEAKEVFENIDNMANSEEEIVMSEPELEPKVDVEEKIEEEPIRELPEIAVEREAIVPVEVEEEEKIEEEEENLHYDYSDVTEKDVEKTNSIALLKEMKRAKEQKERERKEALERADSEERALVMSREEAEAIRKKVAESEKAVQKKMQEFDKFIKSYDAEIEEANKRREKAVSDKEKAEREKAEYEASLASNENIEKEIESMMEEETKKRR